MAEKTNVIVNVDVAEVGSNLNLPSVGFLNIFLETLEATAQEAPKEFENSKAVINYLTANYATTVLTDLTNQLSIYFADFGVGGTPAKVFLTTFPTGATAVDVWNLAKDDTKDWYSVIFSKELSVADALAVGGLVSADITKYFMYQSTNVDIISSIAANPLQTFIDNALEVVLGWSDTNANSIIFAIARTLAVSNLPAITSIAKTTNPVLTVPTTAPGTLAVLEERNVNAYIEVINVGDGIFQGQTAINNDIQERQLASYVKDTIEVSLSKLVSNRAILGIPILADGSGLSTIGVTITNVLEPLASSGVLSVGSNTTTVGSIGQTIRLAEGYFVEMPNISEAETAVSSSGGTLDGISIYLLYSNVIRKIDIVAKIQS